MYRTNVRRSALVVAVSVSLVSGPLLAQEGREKELPQDEKAPIALSGLEVTAESQRRTTEAVDSYTTEVMQTATPLSLSVRETPQSVSVVTRQQIEDQNFTTVADALSSATGITMRHLDSSRYEFAARGFNIDRLLIDGVPTSWRSGYASGESIGSLHLYDHVEVVRGATGLNTGFGNPSAAINLVRKHANSREFMGQVSVSGGEWDTYGATADVTTPLNASGSVRARFVASHEQGDSYTDLLEEETSVLYGVVDADLSDAIRFSLGVSYQDHAPSGSTWGGLPPWYSDGTLTDWDRSKTTAADWTHWSSVNTTYFTSLDHQLDNGWNLQFRYDRMDNDGDKELLYLSGQPNRGDGGDMNASPSRYDTTRIQDTVTLAASGPVLLVGREHELAAGYVYSNMDFESVTFDRTATDPGNFNEWDGSYPEPAWGASRVNDERETTEHSLYAAARLSLTDNANAVIGARLTNFEMVGEDWQGPVDYDHNGVLTPYAGLTFDLNDDISAYASYATIFDPQNEKDASGDVLDPISGDTYELGVKGSFFDDRLNASMAVFRIEQDNVATQDGSVTGPDGSPVTVYRAQEGIQSDGYEVEVAGLLAPGWQISTGLSVFSAREGNGNPANTQFPRRTFKLFTKYRFQEVLQPLTIGGGVNWESRSRKETENPVTGNPQTLEQGAYSLVNLMAKYDFTPRLAAQVNLNNVLDETYYSQIGFYNQYSYGAPRNVTATLRYDF